MTEAVDAKSENILSFSILLEDKELDTSFMVKQLYISKEINKISFCKFTVHENELINNIFEVSNFSNFVSGKKVEIKLGYDDEVQTVFKGVITAHGLRLNKSDAFISIECRDKAIVLTAGRKSAVFEKKKDSEIIAEILKPHNLERVIEETTVVHNAMVQHYCSDWDFIMMRAETSGLIVTTDNGIIRAKKPTLSEPAIVEATYGKNIISFSADIDSMNQYQSISSLSWDPSNQKVVKIFSNSTNEVQVGNQKMPELSKAVNGKEFILQSSTTISSDAMKAWASAKHLKSSLSKLKGKVELAGNLKVEPASLLKLSGLSNHFNGNAFVGRVEHTVEKGEWKTVAHLGAKFEWYTEGTTMVDSPSVSGLAAPFKGLAIGLVRQIDEDKDGQYRIKVAFPTLQKDDFFVWARLANLYATRASGVFFYPEINDEVVVGFLNEDPQHPVIMGMLYSSVNKPPYSPDKENKIKAIVTKSGLSISFDDKDKIIEIITPDKNSVKISDKDAQIILSDKNKNKVMLSKNGVSIETDKDFVLKSKGKITMEAASTIYLKSKAMLKGEGMDVTMEGKTKFSAKAATTEINGSGQTIVKGGMVMIN